MFCIVRLPRLWIHDEAVEVCLNCRLLMLTLAPAATVMIESLALPKMAVSGSAFMVRLIFGITRFSKYDPSATLTTEPDFRVASTSSWIFEKHPVVPPGLTQKVAGLASA